MINSAVAVMKKVSVSWRGSVFTDQHFLDIFHGQATVREAITAALGLIALDEMSDGTQMTFEIKIVRPTP